MSICVIPANGTEPRSSGSLLLGTTIMSLSFTRSSLWTSMGGNDDIARSQIQRNPGSTIKIIACLRWLTHRKRKVNFPRICLPYLSLLAVWLYGPVWCPVGTLATKGRLASITVHTADSLYRRMAASSNRTHDASCTITHRKIAVVTCLLPC